MNFFFQVLRSILFAQIIYFFCENQQKFCIFCVIIQLAKPFMRKVQKNIQLVFQTHHISSFQSDSKHRGRLIEKFSLKHHVLEPMFTCNLIYYFVPVNFIHFFQFLDLSQLFLNLHKLLSCFRLHS